MGLGGRLCFYFDLPKPEQYCSLANDCRNFTFKNGMLAISNMNQRLNQSLDSIPLRGFANESSALF